MIRKFFFVREFLRFPLFFLLLGVTLLLGTLGLTGISIVSKQVQGKLEERALDLLTSDFAVSARRDFSEEEEKKLSSLIGRFRHQTYKIVDIYSMVTHLKSGGSRLMEIRSPETGFPFYGKIALREGTYSSEGIYISPELESLWDIRVGDELQVGETRVKINGVVKADSSQGLRGFSLAPRIYVPLRLLNQSGLLRPGATGFYSRHYKFFDAVDLSELKTEIYRAIKDSGVKVILPKDSSEQTGRVIENISKFMSLAALIGLVLSLVGVFYLYQSHLLARLKDLCLLNLYGLSKKGILLYILGQFSLLFALIFVVQFVAIVPAYRMVLPTLSANLGLELDANISFSWALKQLPFLYGLSLLMLVPLLAGLIRTPMGMALKASKITMGRFRFWDFIPFLVLLWTFAWYLSNSLKIGSVFFASLILIFALSTLWIKAFEFVLKKLLSGQGLLNPNLESGIALRNLMRSGHKLTLSFLSLAMSTTLISLILQLEGKIEAELSLDENRPGLFVFDIQEEQVDDLVDFSRARGTPLAFVTPMIRGRIEKLNGKKYVREKTQIALRDERLDEEENRARNTGLNLTSRNFLSPSEKIVEGEPFPEEFNPDRPGNISLERRYAQRMGFKIGDRITFDIQGVEVEGQVLNIREVKWTSFYPNFFVSVEPGLMEGAPKTFLAVLPAGLKAQKSQYQKAVVEKFPNISFINVEEVISKLAGLFDKSRTAIKIISFLSLLVGLVILYGISHDQVYRRYYDLALLKTLGLSSQGLRMQLLIEFGLLFFMAMGLGIVLGWLIAQLIGQEVFKLPFDVNLSAVCGVAIGLTVSCLATILISSWRTLRARPRDLLADT